MKTFNKVALVSAMSIALFGCGGGGSSDSETQTNDDTVIAKTKMTPTSQLQGKQTGSFQDAAVKGLTYWTASNGLSQTGDNGSFSFEPGEVVVLYLGNDRMILTDAELYSTPMDVLSVRNIVTPGAGHPHQALNALRLLQTIDTTPDQDLITIPDSFHNDRNGSVVGLNFAQDTQAFASSTAVGRVLTEAGKQGEQLVERSVAADHLQATLDGLKDSVVDLRGTWIGTSTYLSEYGADVTPSCDNVGQTSWVVDDTSVFLSGDEIVTDTSGSEPVCTTVDYADTDIDELAGVNKTTRNGIDGVSWSIATNGALDFECGPECSLAELRGTVDDFEELCLSNDYYVNNNANESVNFNEVDYCAESDQHNGPIVGYSEVTFADRLGGDRIIRVKRSFFANFAPTELSERAGVFSEVGLTMDVLNRQEAVDHTVDLTQGEWVIKGIDSAATDTINVPGTISFPEDGDTFPLVCANGYEACTWEELNDVYAGGMYGDVQVIHVRGTNVINFVDGDFVASAIRQ